VLGFIFLSAGIALSVTASNWRRRYTVAAATGAVLGAVLGASLTFVLMAIRGGLPAPWNCLACPIGGLVGGVVLGFAFVVPVAMVHAVWRLAVGRRSA
jgi:hypothetical protein